MTNLKLRVLSSSHPIGRLQHVKNSSIEYSGLLFKKFFNYFMKEALFDTRSASVFGSAL